MAIINQRWPSDLAPLSCRFTRSRNDVRLRSPRTRESTIIRQGRPLWKCELTWERPNTEKLAKLRYWLEALDGYAGSVQLWDFSSPYPYGLTLVTSDTERERLFWVYLGTRLPWTYAGMPNFWQSGSFLSTATDAVAGATVVTFAGLPASTLVAVQGQYIQVDRRLYLVAATVASDVGGNATVTLSSGLLSAAPTGTTVRLVEAACEMELDNSDFDQQSTAGTGMSTVSATFIETVTDK